MKWAEAQYPKPNRSANPSPAVTATGSAEVKPEAAPAGPPKKPASSLNPQKVRQEISDLIRKEFLPGYPSPGGSKSGG